MQTIEAEIIPRLMAAHQSDPPPPLPGGLQRPRAIEPDEINDFADIVLRNESAVCLTFIQSICQRGVPLDAIYLELLAPSARRLGELWMADLCDFTQVTIGLWRMQQVMYDLSPSFRNDNEQEDGVHKRKVMLMTVPGSQHTLGVLMVAEFFRRAGWSVWGEPTADREQLLRAVRREWFDIAGISVGAENQLPGLADFIVQLREASKNTSLCVMIGGPLFVEHPEFASTLGADATSTDAVDAISQAESLVAETQQQERLRQRQGQLN
jgi:methanogenic corrinoid protein MtbC1